MSREFAYVCSAAFILACAAGKGARVLLGQPPEVAWPVAVVVGVLVLVVVATLMVWLPRYSADRKIVLSRLPRDHR